MTNVKPIPSYPIRPFCAIFGVLLIGYGGLQVTAAGDRGLEQQLCRYWGCWNEAVVEQTYQSYFGGKMNASQFSTDLVQALVHEPASSFRWCDLADALLVAGDRAKAETCMRRAVELGPNSAPVLLRAANFEFRVGDDQRALPLLGQILRTVPDYDAIVFSDFDRFAGGVGRTLELAMPSDRRAGQAYLHHLMDIRASAGDLRKTWVWLEQRSLTDDTITIDFVNHLVRSGDIGAAEAVWLPFATRRQGQFRKPNEIFNGDFEVPPTRSVLDWSASMPDGVQLTWATGESHTGRVSLKLDFNAQDNLSFNHVYQEAIVQPGPHRFEAFLKTDGVTTDQGLGFHIVDAQQPSLLDVSTDPVTGTIGWTAQRKDFVVPAQTRLLRIELRRLPSHKFDNKIKGTVWVDSVMLYPTR
jgi:tetratricopeptide (TPR) repeat protein